MKIWHIGASDSPNDVNGVNYAIWAVAKAQVRLGHDVSLVTTGEPSESARKSAESCGLELVKIPVSLFMPLSSKVKKLFTESPAQLVHFHSVFIPNQAILARKLNAADIPFVVTPHGGTSPHILRRNRLKKKLYTRYFENPRFMQAAAITVVTPKEEEEIKAFVPDYKNLIRFVPNPVNDSLFDKRPHISKSARKKIVYLGRFDVLHKGIDILIEIARHLPQIDFHLYGAEDAKTRSWLRQLQSFATCNLYFHEPVYGAKKIEVLKDADLYIQTSRWEAFGISIAEAMAAGLPCAIASTLNIAELFQQKNLGIVFPNEPRAAAMEIANIINDLNGLAAFAARAREYALNNFTAEQVAAKYLECYREALSLPVLETDALAAPDNNQNVRQFSTKRHNIA